MLSIVSSGCFWICLLNFIELLKETPWDNDNYLNTNLKLLLGDNENTGLLDRIKFNFYQSETFYECSYEIDQIALKYIVNKIRQCFTEDGYLLLVEELAKTLNDTIYYDFNSRIYYIAQTLDEKLQSVDITAKQTVLNVISEDIVVQFQGFFQVSSYDVYNYLSYYTISNNYMLAN